jgi:drug/metabolite transporter (DMT)-like permease
MDKKPYIGLLISIISVSFAAIFITTILIIAPGTDPLAIAFYRLFFTSLLIVPVVVIHKKTRDEILNLPRKTMLIMLGIGVILAVHFAFWITSLNYTSVASSVILVTAHPVLVAPVAHYFLKEKLSRINIFGITISLFGVVLLVAGNYGLSSLSFDSLEGNIFAILGGIAAGLYILGGRKIRKTVSIIPYAFVVYSIGTIVLLGICLSARAPLLNLKIEVYQICLLMAVVSGIFGHTLYNWSLGHVRASLASVVLLGEPLGSTILAVIIPWINQIPSHYTIIGGAIILSGIYLTARNNY